MYFATDTGGADSIAVCDGVTTVNPATSLDFTSGATVTDGGGGVAQVAISGVLDQLHRNHLRRRIRRR